MLSGATGPHRPKGSPMATKTAPVEIFVAETETSHFTWQGIGLTRKQAIDALMKAWKAHAKQYDCDPNYLQRDEINVFSGTPGQGFRDRDPLPRP